MQKVQKLTLPYIGVSDPETAEEVELELLGLATVIAVANQRIAVLKQSLRLQELMGKSEDANEQTVTKTPNEETE